MKEPGKARKVILLLGSNIQPDQYMARALLMLQKKFDVIQFSSLWETEPIQSTGNFFLNQAVEIETELEQEDLKKTTGNIEVELGRVRTADKYAPRTMDIDVIIDGDLVLDEKIWQFGFVAVPVAEIRPNLPHPIDQLPLKEIAQKLMNQSRVVLHPAVSSDS